MKRFTHLLLQPPTLAVFVLLLATGLYNAVGPDPVLGDLIIYALIWSGIAQAWNITAGLAGRLSLGHAAYFGLGAYASSILYLNYGVTPWAGALVGAVLAGLAAAVVEIATVRLIGIYYSLATFAIAELLALLARGWTPLTGGTGGLTLPFMPSLPNMTFAGKQGYIWLALGFALICLIVTFMIVTSRFGYFLRAQRDDRDAARMLGVHVEKTCVVAGVISAMLTAIGGTIYAQYLLFIDPDVGFDWYISVRAALLCIIGGLGTLAGPLWGAALLIPVERWIQSALGGSFGGLAPMVYGVVLIVVVLVMPQGIVPRLLTVLRRRRAFLGKVR
jgi:branched-chain amino acid transport system permease protein